MERIISLMLLLSLSGLAFGRVLKVSHAGPLVSVTEAVKQAAGGDTVLVYPGVYYEKGLIIDKAIHLKGVGQPTLDGEHRYEVVTIRCGGVTMEGFLVRHSGYSSR